MLYGKCNRTGYACIFSVIYIYMYIKFCVVYGRLLSGKCNTTGYACIFRDICNTVLYMDACSVGNVTQPDMHAFFRDIYTDNTVLCVLYMVLDTGPWVRLALWEV